jgi:hypothetical protein
MKHYLLKLLSIILILTYSLNILAAPCIEDDTIKCFCYFNDGKQNGLGTRTCIDGEYGSCKCRKNADEYNIGITMLVAGSLGFIVGSVSTGINYENSRRFPQSNSNVSLGVSLIPIAIGLILIGIGSYFTLDGGKKYINSYLPYYTSNSFGWSF